MTWCSFSRCTDDDCRVPGSRRPYCRQTTTRRRSRREHSIVNSADQRCTISSTRSAYLRRRALAPNSCPACEWNFDAPLGHRVITVTPTYVCLFAVWYAPTSWKKAKSPTSPLYRLSLDSYRKGSICLLLANVVKFMGRFRCSLWLYYGVLLANSTLVSVNVFGCLLFATYTWMYYKYTSKKVSRF